MTSRREFFKSTGAGLALASLTDTTSLGAQAVTNKLVSGSPVMEFKVTPPLFCPYYSSGRADQKGGDAYYYKRDAFVDNPFTTPASGMSGSPVVIDANGKMVGFTSSQGYEDSTFSFDGKDTLKVQVPPGQELFVDEHGDGEKAWKDYNTLMMKRLNISPLTSSPTFWSDVEYCTWVEQKFLSTKKQEHFNLLNHDFIKKYLDELIALGYPKGKLTLDHGWGTFPDGTIDSGFGSWVPDPKKFPDFRKTMDLIVNKGFTPGLWIGFPKIHAQSMIAQQYPDLLGSWEAHNTQRKPKDMRYLNPKADIYSYASEVIHRFYKMGVMKFKIDMSYNTKADMLPIHKELYHAAKDIDPKIEMEFHVPDIFFTRYTDVTRTNDVWLNDQYDWPARVKTHYEITYKSSPGRAINLDHVGGNDTGAITEAKFLKHLDMYKSKIGYPMVSVLPSHFGSKAVDRTGDFLWEYHKGARKIVSDFWS